MANIIGGVQVTGFISPTDSSDTYAVIDPIYGVDGLRSVSGTTERNYITTERRREGMLVYVQSDGKYYKLLSSPWNGTDSDWIEFSVGSSFTGGTISEATIFTGGLSATTISASTYLGLPVDVRVTGGTYTSSTGTATFRNNTGGTFNISGFNTVTGGTNGQATFWTGTNTVSGDTAFLWDNTNKRLTIGTVAATFSNSLNITGNINGALRQTFTNSSTGTNARSGFLMNDTALASNYAGIHRGSSSNTNTVTGNSNIIFSNTLFFFSTSGTTPLADGNAPIIFEGTPMYSLGDQTSTNIGFRHDATGFRLGGVSTRNIYT